MLGDGDPHEELFWSLLDVYDADTVHGLPLQVGDVATLAPDLYRERFEKKKRELLGSVPQELEEQVSEDFANQPIVGTDLSNEFQERLEKRVAPLSAVSGLAGFRYDASDPPHWPRTSSEKVRPLPDELVLKIGWPTDDLAVMNAGTRGEMSPRLVEELRKAGVTVLMQNVDPASMWMDAVVPGRGAPMWSLAGIGLESNFYSGAEPSGLVLCVGDEPWDFALAVALERLGVSARWAPTCASDELMALHAYATWALRIRTHTGGPDIRVCSTSAHQAADKVAAALTGQKRDLAVERSDVLDVVPLSPMRMYERDGLGAWQTMLVIDGKTPHLPTPLPRLVESETTDDLHWMTDVNVEHWEGVRHPSLEGVLLAAPALAGGTSRIGREALSYMCPGVWSSAYRSLARSTVRPQLAPLAFQDQIKEIFAAADWRAEPSDKGLYLQKSAAIFGDAEQLIEALTDDRAPVLTSFLSKETEVPGWYVGPESRRYMTLKDFRDLGAIVDPDPVVVDLERVGAIVRGLVLKCAECRSTRFYRQTEFGDEFRCERCAVVQRLTEASWMVGPEPPWRYALSEVVFQFLKNNGDLPLLAAKEFIISPAARSRPSVRRQLQFTGELLLTDPDGGRSELDIVATDGSHLWVGEATTSDKLAQSGGDELERLERFKTVADLLGARGALLISSGEWQEKTEGRAKAAFPDIWPRLEIVSGARQARRPPTPIEQAADSGES